MDTKDVLFELSRCDGPSGFESKVTDTIIDLTNDFVDEIRKDKIGNLILLKKGSKSERKILLEAHVDEIGLIVSGFIKERFAVFSSDGGIDPKILPGQRVRFLNKNGKEVKGVVGYTAPHFGKKTKELKIDDLFIDFSISDEKIEIGDVGVIDVEPVELENKIISGKALDNRASCAVIIGVLEGIRRMSLNTDLYALFAVREEFGSSGALCATYGVKPDYAIILDVTHADVDDVSLSEIKLGGGPVLSYGIVVDRNLLKEFEKVAEISGIPFQREAIPRRSGTDADLIQLVGNGVKTMLISIPMRYMHTPVEVVSLRDLNLTIRLITEFLMRKG